MIISLGNGISNTGTGNWIPILNYEETDQTCRVQIQGSASSFTISIEGKMEAGDNASTIIASATITAKGVYVCPVMEFMRYNITAISGGSLDIKVGKS